MIKNSLKTFLKNLVYLFISMGIFYLFLIIAAYVFVTATIGNLGEMIGQIGDLIQSTATDSSASVEQFLQYSMNQIDWDGNFFHTLSQIFGGTWIEDTVRGFFGVLDESSENFGETFSAILNTFVNKTVTNLVIAVVFIAIGVVLANYATKFAIRVRSAKRSIRKVIIAHTLVPIAQTLILVIFFVLLYFIQAYAFLVVFFLLCMMGVLSLTSSWLIHRDGELKMRDVLTAKNVLKYLLSIFLLLLINVVIDVLVFLLSPLLAVLLLVPLAIYTFNIAEVNTDVFVCSLIEKKSGKAAKAAE